MLLEDTFDRDEFFDDFGELVRITTTSGRVLTVDAIFDEAFETFSSELDYSGPTPKLTVKTDEIDNVAQNGKVIVRGNKTYFIREVRHDGTGISTLILKK